MVAACIIAENFMALPFIFKTAIFLPPVLKNHFMRYFLFFLTAIFLAAGSLRAQSAEDSIRVAIKFLFDGMKASDSAMVKSVFADSAILQTILRTKEGKTIVRTDKVEDFARSISTLAKGAADEQIVFSAINIDGPLASVWTPYKFYFNGSFSHCGVNSFQLVRINGVWKIQYLIDTRRKHSCDK